MGTMLRRTLCTSFAIFLVSLGWAQTGRLIVFGDSLSDMGNAQSYTFGIAPGSGYWQGRFSNGPVWVETVSSHLSMGTLTRSSASGWNFATGGAHSGTGYQSFVIPNSTTQVNSFLSRTTPNSKDLIIFWIGGNDFLDGATTTLPTLNNLAGAIQTLYNNGARQFFVPNLPDLGHIPRYLGTSNQASKSLISLMYNTDLAARLTSLKLTTPGAKYVLFDIGTLLAQIQTNPAQYGFTNVTSASKGVSGINADTYLFWDDIHPTRAAHAYVGMRALKALAELAPARTR